MKEGENESEILDKRARDSPNRRTPPPVLLIRGPGPSATSQDWARTTVSLGKVGGPTTTRAIRGTSERWRTTSKPPDGKVSRQDPHSHADCRELVCIRPPGRFLKQEEKTNLAREEARRYAQGGRGAGGHHRTAHRAART